MESQSSSYPATFEADGPSPQSRLSVFFRLILLIPHAIAVGVVVLIAEILAFLAWFAILFTGRFPGGFSSFMTGALRWQARANGYAWLLTGAYPPFSLGDEEQYPVRSRFDVALGGRNRLTVFFRGLLAIPHVVVLSVLGVIGEVVLLVAWVVALFTASVPDGIHSFLAGVQRYNNRLSAYLFLLTDEYPPFSIS